MTHEHILTGNFTPGKLNMKISQFMVVYADMKRFVNISWLNETKALFLENSEHFPDTFFPLQKVLIQISR